MSEAEVTAIAEQALVDNSRLVKALNTALAHIEGRRGIFSTREPATVATIIRQALGDRVNEERGTAEYRLKELIAEAANIWPTE